MATIKTLLGYVKGPKGDTGEQGIQGVAGSDGAAATIEVGSVTTAAAGTPARVENVGTPSAAIFNFTIPQGQTGSVGDISRTPLNEITSAAGDFPVPVVGDTLATVAGKQAKATQDAQAGIAAANASIATANANIAKVLGDFATVESGANASQAYSVGDFLVKDGLLYKVIAAISAGNALTVGGNIQQTTAGAEIASLNTDLAYKSGDTFTGRWIVPARTDSARKFINFNIYLPRRVRQGGGVTLQITNVFVYKNDGNAVLQNNPDIVIYDATDQMLQIGFTYTAAQAITANSGFVLLLDGTFSFS